MDGPGQILDLCFERAIHGLSLALAFSVLGLSRRSMDYPLKVLMHAWSGQPWITHKDIPCEINQAKRSPSQILLKFGVWVVSKEMFLCQNFPGFIFCGSAVIAA